MPSETVRIGQGDRVVLPDGRSALVCEMRGSLVRVIPFVEWHPWPLPAEWVDGAGLKRAPMRYFGEVA